ncbi:hypothetical protein H4Q26_003706 [Puccinia striiformis f. sp. tritici PST-130]|nr:hypothetical protein H4Q26_003706 [Puccinia striiformis f. sp. tritici PST-130]
MSDLISFVRSFASVSALVYIVIGLPTDLCGKANEWELLDANPFEYPHFEKRLISFNQILKEQALDRPSRPPPSSQPVACLTPAANEEFESFPPPTFEDAELSVINAREIDTVDAVQLNEDDRLAPEFCTGDLAHNLDWREMAAIQEDMYVSPTPSCPPSPSRSTGLPLRGRFTACRTAPSISVGIRLPTHQHRFQPQPTSLPATTTSSNFAATAI